MAIDNRRKLYDALSQDYDMGSYEQFCTDLNDEAKRRKLYDATIQEYDFGSWDSFSQQLGYSLANTLESQLLHPSVSTIDDGPVANASTTTAHVPQGYHDEDGIFHPYPISDTATDTATSPVPQNTTGNEGENGWQPSPMQKAAMIAEIQSGVDKTIGNMRNSVENVRRLVESNSTEGRNKRKAAEMQARMVGTPTKVPGLTAGIKSSTTKDAPNEPGNPNSPIPYGVKMENGEAKTEWLLPDGTLSTSLIDADKAEFGARKARLQHEFVKRMEENGLDPAKESDIEEQRKKDLLDVAEIQTESRLAENEEHLHKLYDKRAGELDQQREWDDDEGFWSNFVRIVGGAANSTTTINAPKQQSSTIEDKEIGTYMAENQILTDARKLLETRKLNKSYGFMGGFWNIGNNWRNMKMGAKHTLSDSDYYLNGVMALQKASRLMEIEDKLKQGAELTDAEVSLVYSAALGQVVQNNTDTPHGYTVAQIELEMFPFMAQMALNPASGLSRAMVTKFGKSGLRKIAMKKAAQGLTEEAAAQFAKRETRKLAAKAVGVQVAGDVAESAVLANTLQGAKTAADAMERYQGNVVINDNGIITFDGNHNWAEAIYKAEASATIENYTEMLGEHFGIIGNALGKGAGKGLRAIGGGKIVDTVSDMIAKIGTNEWGKAISAVEKRAHWNGSIGEILEEEAGIVLNSIFTGDNKISDLWDADQQIDIVLGVGLFGGFMSGLKTVGYPIGKSKAKGNLRKSDSIGAWRFGDGWTYIRDEINNAEGKDLGNVVRDLVRGHAKSDEQGKAIVEYAHALMNSRGYEIASASARSEGTSSPEQQDIEESFEHGEHLAETEVPQEMGDAKRMLDLQRQRLASALSEDVVHDFDTDPIGALSRTHDPDTRLIAADYVNAKAVYDGMIQRVRDDIDGRIAQSDAMIDGRVNRTTGMIQPATMRSDGKETQVYVVDGELAMFEDGSGIDTQNSSESIIIRDAETGKIEFADPTRFVNVDNGIDAETEKEAVRQQIRQEVAQAAANKIDGVLSFTPGDTYNVLDMDGQPQVVSIVGQPVDENGVPVEGQVNIQYPDGQIQQVAMSDLQQQVDAANAQRVENFVSENAETVPKTGENAEISTENGENITENVPKTVERAENIQEYGPSLYDENTIQPVGQGRFGYIYNQFKGKAMAAFHFLLNLKNGEAKGVFHRDDLGDIDVIWGTEKGGLYHIIKKHIIEQADFNSVEDAVERISDVVEHGEPIVHGDETLIIKDGYKAVLARNDDGRFVLTAYDNNRSVAEKKRTAEEATLFHQSLLGGRMVNHVSPVSDSLGKVNATDGDLQESPISESTVKPVGTGMFGNIFNAFKQKAKEAAAFLYKLKGGEALDVFTRDEIGGISLVWGDDTKGLQHIIRKHIVEHSDFESVSEMVESLNGVITNGDIIIQKGGNYRIEKDGYRAIIAKSEDGGFVLTAYDKTRTQDDKRRSDADAALFDQRVSEEMNGTLVSSDTAPAGKDNATEGDLQASALSRIPMDDNGGYRFDAVDPETAWDGMVEFMENEDDASEYAAAMVGESEAAVKKAKQAITKIKPANDPAKFKAAKAAARSALSETQRQMEHWQNVVGVASSRRAAIGEAARQQAEAERAAQIAAEARREAELQAEARRKVEEEAAAPREYAKAYAGWEQPATFEEYVLRRLSAGGMKLKWGKNERTGTNGLGAMLGYGSGTREQQGLLWLLDNANGYYPEEAAERMLVDFKAETGMEPNMDAMDAHNTLLDVIATHGTSRAMWTEAKRRHDAMEATAPIDEEYERQREWYETHFGMSPEEYEAYEEQVYSDIAAHEMSEDEMSDFIATFADAILTGQKERDEYERNREHDNSAADSLRERGDEILPEKQPDIDTGDNPLVQRAQEADGNGNRPYGGSPQEKLSKEDASGIIAEMEQRATVAPELELTIENWDAQFGESGIVSTPIGDVKMGENQFTKLMRQGRNGKLGMIKPTLENPDIIIEDASESKDADTTERASSYVFVKTFVKPDGSRYYYFTSVTVSKEGHEVVVSNQEKRRNVLTNLLMKGKLVWKHADNVSSASDMADGLYSPQGKMSDPASEGTDAPQTNNAYSERKVTNSASEKQAEPAESSMSERIAAAEAEVNTDPTDAQKSAGNYKKGHVQVGTFDVTIENPAGSVRSGVDADGKPWSNTMHNTYGYIRGTVGVDGDHIDVYLSSDIDGWNGRRVFVMDVYNPDGTFDEHKVMLGFNEKEDAAFDFAANYDNDWVKPRKIEVHSVTLDDFEKWIESSKRKTKPFGEYAIAKKSGKSNFNSSQSEAAQPMSPRKAADKPVNPSGNRLVSDERYAEIRERMRKKIGGQFNMGVDPEILALGAEMAVYHIERGARKFAAYASAMIADLGDTIRPYLKSFYNAVRDMPEAEATGLISDMDSYDDVRRVDIANFDKANTDAMATAAAVVAEQEAEKQREEAEKKLKEQRKKRLNPNGSTTETVVENGTEIEITTGDFIPGVLPTVVEAKKKPGKEKSKPVTDGGLFDTVEDETTTSPSIIVPEPRPAADLIGDSSAYQDRGAQTAELVEEIGGVIESRVMMLQLDAESVKPLTMTEVKKMASKYSALKDISDTDLQELVELAMTQLIRSEAIINIDGTAEQQRAAFDHIVNLYQIQPSLNARDSERLIKQQYSTPTPFGYVMGQFVRAGGKTVGSMLEPSAGNGALTITVHPSLVHVNDIDEARLANLRKLGYGQVTAQDALLPFAGDKVDVVMTNPPFGTVTEKVYDGVFRISSLEGQMAINALKQMKDDGRAAIVIGGNTSYRTNGSMNPKDAAFFGYLYSHYNVADVINISGKALYSRNGTGYDVRMILIDGRKTGEFQRVFPPVKAKARAEQVTTFDELYKRVQDDIQQIQQVGSQSANVQRDHETAADGTASAPVRSGNNRPNTGAGQRPGTASDAIRDTPWTDSGQPTPGNVGSRPAGVDNADTGNAGSTDNVPQSKPEQPRSVGGGSTQNGTGRSGSNGRGTVTTRPDRSAERLEVKPDLTTEKVPYPNQSDNGFTLMSVVPAAQAQVLQKSLGEIGDVDQYLVDELGYSSKEELYGYLAAEQIDSVALAIHQMDKGNAFIIGDMTGVGKGRQGAALIRYAVKQGKVPIYFTQKPTLYTDNYRDLCDIGSSDLRPFIIASNPKDANIVDADGNVVHKLPSKKEQERVFNYIMEHGTLPDEYDYVLTTYDQIKNGTADYSQNEDGTWNTEARKLPKKSKGYTTADYNGQARRDALAKLAEGNITILDESHTVGGDSGCGRYMQMLTSQAGGVTFLSATFAKRADNMPIYAQRTAIAEAGVKASELIDAIMKGGVTLQEIMSKQLVESGQMIRRERSFDGVTIDWLNVAEETNRHQRQQFNDVAAIFNAIRNFQDDYITPLIDAKNEAAAEHGATVGHTRGTKDMGVKNVPFASKMYNLVNQLLFALKVDAVADRVVENLRNGYKPVISFTNTMEGFLSSAPKGVAMDDVPNFSLTLMRALDGVMRFTEKDADENSEGGSISLSELSTEGQNAYNAIREKIMSLSADLPISPMDAIRMKIEEAGYSVAEITGRTMQLNRTEDGRYIVEARKDRDKKAAMRDFNSGKLDVLMINKSGSTGISLHASSKFEDQRPRVMVFAQFQSDINDEVQMRGRIDRSGQVTRGRYEYIMSTIPAEQRIQMMFKAKLKSLDANTTSSQKSKFNEMEIVDYLNKYGDEVVWEYMKEHPELEERLGDPLDMLQEKKDEDGPRTSEKEDTSKKSGCAGKISRYLAFLSVEEQDEIFREITEAYRVKIQLLDDAGENDLEITTMPLRAETKRKQIWHEGENPGSGNAFADNTYVEEVEVDVLKKPMKRAEIEEATCKLVGNKGIATEYDQQRYGFKEGEVNWNRYAETMQSEIDQFFQSKADEAVAKLKEAGDARVAKTREKAVAAATKARSRGENNFTDEEIQSLADTVANEAREKEEAKQRKRRDEIMANKQRITTLLTHLRAGAIYVVPQDIKQGTAEMFSQTFGTFVGFKFNKSYTLGSSTAIFATLDGRRKVELALSDNALSTIISATQIAYRYSPKEINAISMDNWDSHVPTQTRQNRYIITGNLLQALVDTEKGDKTRGNLISFSNMDGETRQGILMGENFKLTDLRNSASLSSRLAQIREGQSVVSENGDVRIEKVSIGWQHRDDYELRVPKSKQRGGIYTMHPDLLKLVDGNNFITKGNNMVAYVTEANIAKVVDMLSRAPFNVTVFQESKLSDVSSSETEQERLRMGEGAYTDEELSMANDPWSKAWGESLRTKRQQKEFASRERKRMAERVKELTERLHLDNVEVVTDTSTLSGKRATAKGFFNNRTGKITIVLPNNSSATDIEQTLLHEAVAHYGLRQLLGNHFDEFLDKVYEAADEVIKARIDVLAIRNGWDRRVATEEYMAALAEDADFDRAQERIGGWFSKIKHFFIDMLRKVGFKNISSYSLRDNELRYILWRSYQNLANPGRYRAFEWEAEDVAMQYGLSVGEYAPHDAITESRVAEAGELDEINERFNEQLKRWEMGKMRPEEIVNVGYPMGIMRLFMPKLPLLLRQKVLSKSRKKHGLTAKEMSNLPGALANPIFVFKSNPKTISVLTELKSDKGENLFVAVELGKDLDFGGNAMVVNDILTVHGREVENIVLPIKENNTLIWVDKKKGLKWLLSAKSNSQAITAQTLDDTAKIVERFENPTINEHNNNVESDGKIGEISIKFNQELDAYEKGQLAPGHRFELGMPSRYLRSAGFPNLPISMRAFLLKIKSGLGRHPFAPSDLKGLVDAIQRPIAIFSYSKENVRNLIVDIQVNGKNFLVGVTLNYKSGNIEINSISGLFPKDNHEWMKWIQDGKAIRIDQKEKVQQIIDSLRMNPAEAERIGLNLDDTAKIVERFENPTIDEHNNNVEDDGDVRFRDGDFTPRDRKLAAEQYERMLSRGSWQFKEAVQDSMLGLKTLYESILGKGTRIEDVAGYENAYLYENRMSSSNNGEQHQYFIQYMEPLLNSIYDLCGNDKLDRRILTDYMMAKHGLERNEKMRIEAAAKKEDTDRDFAGLCGLTGEDSWISAEAEAQKMVDEYERDHDTTQLWENVRKATNATLEKIYLSGLISEDTFNKVQGMYDFYIPLRGWDETTSNEVYGYLTSNDGPLTGNVFKKATGRKSKADDPIATIAMMADDAIRQGNRNIMKQRFLNFVHGNPSDLVSINDMWLQHDDVTDEWKPVFAELKPDMTHEEVEREVAKFEAKMERLKKSEPDKYARGNDARNIPYKVANSDLREHQVLVKRNGRTYVMTINGNPRAAQALNGLTNPDVEMGGVVGNLLKGAEYVNRNLSAFYTTRNPDFVVSNFMRDTLYSNCMAWVKESPSYALRFHKNFGKVNPVILGHLLYKWENGTLDDSNKLERMFKEFMLNGGETGYTSVKDIEGHKRTIASELKKHGNIGRKAWSALGMQLDLLNRSAENCARFAAFLTSREMGRTLDRSIYDAKEVSVNFNKKGSGGKFVNATGQTVLGKIGAYTSGSGRILYVFWNAGIQGMTNFGRAAKRHPGKALGGAAALFTLGYVIPLLAQMCGSGDGDDDKNAYYNLPEHIRRSNICFHVGDQWITIPLPIEYRAIYGMGELACGVISGNERYSNSELAYHMAAQVSQAMPLDVLEGDGGFSAFIPSAVKPVTEAYVLNKSWSGLPIYKDTPFNKNDPEWTKAYQSADQHLVAFSKWLNETSGGDDYKKGAIDINPAKIEYLLSGTFGGVFTTFENLKKTGETIIGKREFEWRNTPIANRIVKSGDERTANRKLQNEYFKYFDEYKETKRLYRKYDNAAANGILGYAEKADFLYNSPEYLRLEKFEEYKPEMDAFRAQLKEETDPKKKKEIQAEMFGTMRELVDSLRVVGQ